MKKKIEFIGMHSNFIDIKTESLYLCKGGVKKFFCLPKDITSIDLVLSTKPIKESYRVLYCESSDGITVPEKIISLAVIAPSSIYMVQPSLVPPIQLLGSPLNSMEIQLYEGSVVNWAKRWVPLLENLACPLSPYVGNAIDVTSDQASSRKGLINS